MSNCCAPKTPFVPEQVLKAVDQIEKLCVKRIKQSGDAPSLQPDTGFGFVIEMSSDGNILVISAPAYDAKDGEGVEQTDSGAVFVFRRKESFAACENAKRRSERYKLQQILVATDPKTGASRVQQGALFGNALSVSGTGSRIVVGAPSENSNDGAVYVFDQKSESLLYRAVQRIGPDQTGSEQIFGFETALSKDGRVLFVSEGSFSSEASVLMYEDCGFDFSTDCFRQSKKNKGFVLKQTVNAEQLVQGTNVPVENVSVLGFRLKLSENGNTALISAPGSTVVDESENSVLAAGLVFVVQRFANHKCSTGVTKWSTTQVLTSKTPQDFAPFGTSLALTPDARFAVVEEPSRDKENPEREDVGLVSVFERAHKDCTYRLKAELCPTGENIQDRPGDPERSVVISDDGCTIAVGYEETTVSEIESVGVVVTYQRRCGSSEWKQTQVLTSFPSVEDHRFGTGLAISGDGNTLAVGAWEGSGTDDFVYTFSSRFVRKN